MDGNIELENFMIEKNLSLVQSRTINDIDYLLLRNNDDPRKTFLKIGDSNELVVIKVKDYLDKYKVENK